MTSINQSRPRFAGVHLHTNTPDTRIFDVFPNADLPRFKVNDDDALSRRSARSIASRLRQDPEAKINIDLLKTKFISLVKGSNLSRAEKRETKQIIRNSPYFPAAITTREGNIFGDSFVFSVAPPEPKKNGKTSQVKSASNPTEKREKTFGTFKRWVPFLNKNQKANL